MPPEHARAFGGGAVETALSPVVLAALILAAVLIVTLPRKYAVVPLLVVTFLVPFSQVIVVAGSHFFVLRIVLMAGLAKMMTAKVGARSSILGGGYNSIDRAFFWSTVCQTIAVIVLFGVSAVANQMGFLLDFLGGYFILRYLISDTDDVDRVLKCLAIISCILAVCMLIEQVELFNVFSVLEGKVAEVHVRDGKIRSQGVFQHELTAGAFAATLLPMFVLLWKRGGSKGVVILGILSSTVMTISTNSSTSLLTYGGAVLGISFWPIRKNMRRVRLGIVVFLLAAAVFMKAPVWFVIAHIDLTGSSSGYHRAVLIDTFIRHFGDWWLIGARDTGSWGWDMWDAQNQFVNIGETGGLVALCVFIIMIVQCFRRLGAAMRVSPGDRQQQWCIWLSGCALFSHVVAFFGVNYFDQARVGWFILLSAISVISLPASRVAPAPLKPAVKELWFTSAGRQDERINRERADNHVSGC